MLPTWNAWNADRAFAWVLAFSLAVTGLTGSGCGGQGNGEGDDDTSADPSPTANQPPTASIESPGGDDHIPLSRKLSLSGQVSDAETAVDQLLVTWNSDVEGSLGDSSPDGSGLVGLSVQLQEAGEQVITLTVTDAEGVSSTADVSIIVDGPPAADINGAVPVSPQVGDEVTISGTVTDDLDDPRNLEIKWTDDQKHNLGSEPADKNGKVSMTTTALAAGKRTITLTVSDSEGQETVATLKVTVQSCEDGDGDDYTVCSSSGPIDCDDDDPAVNPGAAEVCDGKDNNCDDETDEGFADTDLDDIADCVDTETCDGVDNNGNGQIDESFPDTDGDGVADCRDSETCDGKDNDGNGKIDEGFPDGDKDGVADCIDACPDDAGNDLDKDGICSALDNCPSTANASQLDSDKDGIGDACDIETCNGIDDNGNGQVDEGFDLDKDGYTTCNGDCNDSAASVHPGVTEVCDAIDNNCDGKVDEGFDVDKDGYTTCRGDCNDSNASVYPTALEVCDAVDNNCDGRINEGIGDTYEPNDTLQTAFDLGDRNGKDTPVKYTLQGTISSLGDSDWYRMYLVDESYIGADDFFLKVTLSNIPFGTNYDLYLWWDEPDDTPDKGPALVEQSSYTGNTQEMVNHPGVSGPNNGGYYWIEVRAASGYDCGASYLITYENMG